MVFDLKNMKSKVTLELKIILVLFLFFILLIDQTPSQSQNFSKISRDMILLKPACFVMGSEEYVAEAT